LNPLQSKYKEHLRYTLPPPNRMKLLDYAARVGNTSSDLDDTTMQEHEAVAPHAHSGNHTHPLASTAPHVFKGVTNDIQLVQRRRPEGSATVPKMVWTVWLGKPMWGARLRAFKEIEASVGVPVRLVQVLRLVRVCVCDRVCLCVCACACPRACVYVVAYFALQFAGFARSHAVAHVNCMLAYAPGYSGHRTKICRVSSAYLELLCSLS
jgi:hypothetical protein